MTDVTEALLTWQTSAVAMGAYVLVALLKVALTTVAPWLRESRTYKRLVLPAIATLLGALLALLCHPTIVTSPGEALLWGAGVGYMASALVRHLGGLVPGLNLTPSMRPTLRVPPPPNNPSERVLREEHELP